MTDKQILSLFPVVVFVLAFSFIFVGLIKASAKKIFKMILKTFIISIVIIVAFTFVYFIIFVADISALNRVGIASKDITGDMLRNIKGIDFTNVKEHYYFIFIDLFCYSASIFFHNNSNISIAGVGNIFVALESFMGMSLPLIIITLLLRKSDDGVDNVKILTIYLSRGWNILSTRESSSIHLKDYQHVELISPDKELKVLFIKETKNTEELINNFKINWKSTKPDLIPYFMKALQEILIPIDYKLASTALMFYIDRKEIDLEYYEKLAGFLKKIQYQDCFINSDITYEEIQMIINLIETEMKQYKSINISNDILSLDRGHNNE